MTLEKRIKQLEYQFAVIRNEKSGVYGTTISRVLLDSNMYKEHKIPEGTTGSVWCVGFGGMGVPWHSFFYGITISTALDRAEESLNEFLYGKDINK